MSDTAPRAPYRFVVIGSGAIANTHAEAVAAHPGRGQITHAIDADASRAEDFAGRHGVPHWGTDLDAVLKEGPDLALICTPPGSHLALARQCLLAGVPVLLEKPPVLSLAELDELIKLSQRTGTDIAVVFQHRFGASAIRARKLLSEGAFGRPLVATCDTLWFRDPAYFAVPWRGRWEVEGGGTTMGHGIHQFDLLVSLLGPWEEVSAMAARQARDTATEDVSVALVRFADGTLATVANSAVSARQTSALRIDTEHATLELTHLYGYTEQNWTVTAAPGHEEVAAHWAAGATVSSGPSSHIDQMAAIYAALDAGSPMPVQLSQVRRTLELTAAIYASAFTGQKVRRGEIGPGNPFYTRMDGSGAPWADTASLAGARSRS